MSLPFIGADVRVSDRLLAITLAASIFLHAVVLAVKFSPFDLSALDRSGPPLEVALAWVRDRPGVTSAIVGARTAAQLRGWLQAEDVDLPDEIRKALDEVSTPALGYPERSEDQR